MDSLVNLLASRAQERFEKPYLEALETNQLTNHIFCITTNPQCWIGQILPNIQSTCLFILQLFYIGRCSSFQNSSVFYNPGFQQLASFNWCPKSLSRNGVILLPIKTIFYETYDFENGVEGRNMKNVCGMKIGELWEKPNKSLLYALQWWDLNLRLQSWY